MELHLHIAGRIDLPLAYRYFVQSMLYRALAADPDYAEGLHDGREGPEGRQFKLFTFGQLTGQYTVSEGRICFPAGASLEVRSGERDLLLRLMESLAVGKEVQLEKNRCAVSRCSLEHHVIGAEKLQIATLSPIVAYTTDSDKRTHFYPPDTPEFASLVAKNAGRKWQMRYGDAPVPPVKITYLGGLRKQVTMFKTTRITAYHGRFRLEGHPAMLDLLYHTGLGAKSSQGFGMFEIV